MDKKTLETILKSAPLFLAAASLSILLACTQAPYEMKEVREKIHKKRQRKIKEQKRKERENSSFSSEKGFVYKPNELEDSSRTLFKHTRPFKETRNFLSRCYRRRIYKPKHHK